MKIPKRLFNIMSNFEIVLSFICPPNESQLSKDITICQSNNAIVQIFESTKVVIKENIETKASYVYVIITVPSKIHINGKCFR